MESLLSSFARDDVIVPVEVPGLDSKRLDELNPFNYRTMEEMRMFLEIQITKVKEIFDTQVKGLDKNICKVMDF